MTSLSILDIESAMTVCKYRYETLVDVDSFTDRPMEWYQAGMRKVLLTLFDELRIVKAISR